MFIHQTVASPLPPAAFHGAAVRDCPLKLQLDVRHVRYVPAEPVTPQLEQRLVDMNYGRNGRDYVQPACPDCYRCRNVRIPARTGGLTRSMLRRLRCLQGWTTQWGAPGLAGERTALLERFIEQRFNRGPNLAPLRAFLGFGGNMHGIQELRQPNGTLAAMSAVARLQDGLMSLYAAWDPALARLGLGHALTWGECAESRRMGLTWLHLGPVVEGDARMQYKLAYVGAERLVGPGQWEPFVRGPSQEMKNHVA